MLAKVRLYGHILKLSEGKGHIGLHSSIVAVATDSFDRINDTLQTKITLPRISSDLSIIYIGNFDKWSSLTSNKNGKLLLIKRYKHILHIDYDQLIMWVKFLAYRNPQYNITPLNEKHKEELNNFAIEMISSATISIDPISSAIEKSSSTNVPGAPTCDVENDEYGPVQFYELDMHPQEDNFSDSQILKSILQSLCSLKYNSSSINNANNSSNSNNITNNRNLYNNINHNQYFNNETNHYDHYETDTSNNHQLINEENKHTENMNEYDKKRNNFTEFNNEKYNKNQNIYEAHDNNKHLPNINISHSNELINEYTDIQNIMSGAFPYTFLLSYPYNTIPNDKEIKHMMEQATNELSSNTLLIMYIYDLRARNDAAIGVNALWKNDSKTLDILTKALDSKTFLDELNEAVKKPTDPKSIILLKWILPLLQNSGKKIKYGQYAGSKAISDMKSLTRDKGNGANFLTISPQSILHILPFRIGTPIKSNNGDLSQKKFVIPETTAERKEFIINNPYADAFFFMRLTWAIFNKLLKIKMPNPGEHLKTNHISPVLKKDSNDNRGILGHLKALFYCTETTTQGFLHIHCKCYDYLDWNFLSTIAHKSEMNTKYGKYMDSIIASELPYEKGWNSNPYPIRPDPSKPYRANPSTPSTTTLGMESFESLFLHSAIFVQNHGNHNFSCFKGDRKFCRFDLPSHSWNQNSGLVQVNLITDKLRTIKPKLVILKNISERKEFKRFQSDERILIFNSIKRSSDNATIREIKNSQETKIEYLADEDINSKNGLFSPCNKVLLVAALCHNNIQRISKEGMGSDAYIAKYIAKGSNNLVRNVNYT